MCRVPSAFIPASLAGNTVTASMNSGRIRVLIRNDLVRTRSRYSRRMISQTLRIACPHHVDEDLLQRGLHQFELADARPRYRHPQQFLRIGAGLQTHFDVIAVVVEAFNQRALLEEVTVAF